MIFKVQYDFAGGTDVDFKDVWVGLTNIPYVGTVKVGHYKEPFSLEELTSSKYISFLERALPNAFAPSRNVGIMLTDAPKQLEQKMTWAVGVFRDAGASGDSTHDDAATRYNLTARVTGLPYYEEKGARLVHVGAGWTLRDPEDNALTYSQRPEAHLAPTLATTGAIADADMVNIFNVEAALVYGPFSLQGEYFHTMVDSDSYDDPDYNGYYIFGSWFITGEHRNYKKSAAVFDRVVPKQDFDLQGGPGALELLVRFSGLDLDDGAVDGGRIMNIGAGLNWYLNPNVQVMLNYIHTDYEQGAAEGTGDITQIRFQFTF